MLCAFLVVSGMVYWWRPAIMEGSIRQQGRGELSLGVGLAPKGKKLLGCNDEATF
jgi:hypothetical protein